MACARCKGCRVATLFCPPVEEPKREAGPAAMGHPPWGSKHGLYVVVVNAGGAPKGPGSEAATRADTWGWRFTAEHGDTMDSPQI